MSEIKVEIPAKIELKVIVVDDNGRSGEVAIELRAMELPTKQSIIDAIDEVSQSEFCTKQGFRVAEQRETFDYICREIAGGTFAMPSDCGHWYTDEINLALLGE